MIGLAHPADQILGDGVDLDARIDRADAVQPVGREGQEGGDVDGVGIALPAPRPVACAMIASIPLRRRTPDSPLADRIEPARENRSRARRMIEPMTTTTRSTSTTDRTLSVVCDDAEATRRLGAVLGGLAQPGAVVLLQGDLGAGKTVFAQGVGRGLDVPAWVNSPTFVLMNEHLGGPPSPAPRRSLPPGRPVAERRADRGAGSGSGGGRRRPPGRMAGARPANGRRIAARRSSAGRIGGVGLVGGRSGRIAAHAAADGVWRSVGIAPGGAALCSGG